MKFKIKKKEVKYLFTCKHVILQKFINNKETINLYYGEYNKEDCRKIILDENIRFMKTFKEDVTLIEIIENDKISEDKYLDIDLNYKQGYNQYKGNNFYLAGYPHNYNQRCISVGKIIEIIDISFSHTLYTSGGSSGSPICNENGKVIGIHTSGDKINKINYGIFIGKIIDILKNESNNYIIAEFYISDKDIDKNIRIINSYEQVIREHPWYQDDDLRRNEKELKENCIIKVNGIKIPFTYFYKFKTSGKCMIEYSFKNYITKTNYMLIDCISLINLVKY